jgi:hypothetical protein
MVMAFMLSNASPLGFVTSYKKLLRTFARWLGKLLKIFLADLSKHTKSY